MLDDLRSAGREVGAGLTVSGVVEGMPHRQRPLVSATPVRGAAVAATVGAVIVVLLLARARATPPISLVEVNGTVVDDHGSAVPGVLVTFDGTDVQFRTDSRGAFVGELPRVDADDVITLRATHPEYMQQAEVRRVDARTETYRVVMQGRPGSRRP
jgi:hypothetical protein